MTGKKLIVSLLLFNNISRFDTYISSTNTICFRIFLKVTYGKSYVGIEVSDSYSRKVKLN